MIIRIYLIMIGKIRYFFLFFSLFILFINSVLPTLLGVCVCVPMFVIDK